jgi:hypothetical protein
MTNKMKNFTKAELQTKRNDLHVILGVSIFFVFFFGVCFFISLSENKDCEIYNENYYDMANYYYHLYNNLRHAYENNSLDCNVIYQVENGSGHNVKIYTGNCERGLK